MNDLKSLTLELTEEQATTILKCVDDKIAALHNHIAIAIESKWEGAHSAPCLVRKLREHEEIRARINTARREATGHF